MTRNDKYLHRDDRRKIGLLNSSLAELLYASKNHEIWSLPDLRFEVVLIGIDESHFERCHARVKRYGRF